MFYIERLSALVIFAIVSIILILAITGLFEFAAANTILTPFRSALSTKQAKKKSRNPAAAFRAGTGQILVFFRHFLFFTLIFAHMPASRASRQRLRRLAGWLCARAPREEPAISLQHLHAPAISVSEQAGNSWSTSCVEPAPPPSAP